MDVKKNWDNVIIITNNWHMKRTKAIFEKVLSLPSASKAAHYYKLQFVSVDAALPLDILALRQKREADSLKTFLTETSGKWSDLDSLHSWLFTSHTAYAASRFAIIGGGNGEEISIDLAKTY